MPDELPPIEGPKRAMFIMAHPDDIDFLAPAGRSLVRRGLDRLLRARHQRRQGHPRPGDDAPGARRHARGGAARRGDASSASRSASSSATRTASSSDAGAARPDRATASRQYKPDVVLTWDGFRNGFNHSDHRNIGIAVARRRLPGSRDHLYYPGAPGGRPGARLRRTRCCSLGSRRRRTTASTSATYVEQEDRCYPLPREPECGRSRRGLRRSG